MSTAHSTVPATTAPAEEELLLRDCLQRSPAIDRRIIQLRRERLESSTSYQTSALTLELEGGRGLRLFLKDFAHSVRPKDDAQQRREREMRFYRDLAPQGELGTPRYYGSVWDPSAGRHWLIVAFVRGTPVRYCEFEHWPLATAWLGRMHGYFARRLDRLAACDFLARHDEEFFASKARVSLEAVRRVDPAEGVRLAEALRDYDRAVATMLHQPRTLLHGGFRPINVLIHIDGEPQRTCVIDWEEAGLGAPLSDLAYFVDGFDRQRLQRLLDAYRAGAARYDLPLPGPDEMTHVINCFRLHKLVHSLQKYVRWNVSHETVVRLVGEVAQYAKEARA